MRALILPLILAVFGAGAGAGAGWFLKPKPEMAEEKSGKEESGQEAASARNGKPGEQDKDGEGNDTTEFVKLNNQFIIPVVNNEQVSSMVVMSLSLEVELGLREAVYAKEPKLRDALLQVMFDHANIGGFNGSFTNASNLQTLRTGLTDAARQVVPGPVLGVLIGDIARQDL